MSVPEYEDRGAVDTTSEVDLSNLAGKSVIITGGANGLGLAYAKAFVNAGAFVTIGDFDERAGKEAEAELAPAAKFVKCDVREWDDQVALFEAAAASSPSNSVDVVIANAGVIGADDLGALQDPFGPPSKPDFRTIDITLIGMAYTAKLAMHYFRRQSIEAPRDRCLILKGSLASYVDQPGSPQYNISKWGVRGLFRCLRRTSWRENIRVNFVAPWYVHTPILSDKVINYLTSKGVNFATVEDCAAAILRIASDQSLHGRSLGVVPRQETPKGYMDVAHDDYQDGDFMKGWQETVIATAESIIDLA